MNLRSTLLAAVSVAGAVTALGMATPASAAYVMYQDLPSSLAVPPNVSFHNASGPVIADDFAAAIGGQITHLTWWGSSTTDNNFEVVLQDNNAAAGEPAITPAGNTFSGGLKQFVTATQTAFSIPGIFQFDADVAPGWSVGAGTEHWLTVANTSPGWNWALALAGPTVGTELFNAHSSVGPGCGDGGPHCGPWTDLHTDFAFQINGVPEPATWAMMLVGFGGLGAAMRMRRREAMTTA